MNRFDDKAISIKCMVNGCNNDRDLSSTQHLCRPCYDVITTANTDQYYADHKGSTWMTQIITWNYNLRSEVKDLEYNQEHAYFHEDGKTMSLNDLRNFYVENRDLRAVSHKQCSELVTHQFMVKGLKQDNEALKKDHEYKSHIIDRLEKEIKALNYNMDHAHQDGDKFLTVDDLCIFYDEHKNSTPKDDGKFQAYTEGFWKGFDLGYQKAKEKFDD